MSTKTLAYRTIQTVECEVTIEGRIEDEDEIIDGRFWEELQKYIEGANAEASGWKFIGVKQTSTARLFREDGTATATFTVTFEKV